MGLDNPTHWIPILVVLLLIFGARRLPEIGRSLGSGIREFKGAITGESEKPEAPAPPIAPPPAEAPSADPSTTAAVEQPEHAGSTTG